MTSVFDDLFEFSWLAIKDGMGNTIGKRNADAVKTTKFLCIMAASILGLFRLFSIDLMRSIKHSKNYCNIKNQNKHEGKKQKTVFDRKYPNFDLTIISHAVIIKSEIYP